MKRCSQLGREGQEKKDHRYRPHALIEARQPQVQQRIPHWHPQGRPWPHRRIRLNDDDSFETDGLKRSPKRRLVAFCCLLGGISGSKEGSFLIFHGIRAMNFLMQKSVETSFFPFEPGTMVFYPSLPAPLCAEEEKTLYEEK